MGMLRVDPVADREEGLWPAARDDHGAWPRPEKKARDRKSLVKYVDCMGSQCAGHSTLSSFKFRRDSPASSSSLNGI